MSEKLTKKQLKAKQFRTPKTEKDLAKEQAANAPAAAPVKKRKTRRGRKGKPRSTSSNRFIIFVGSLPPNITQSELQAHFKSSSPDVIRIRADKNIAFLEFDPEKDDSNIQHRMDIALLQHRTVIREKKINVELTVGGGGNSKDRLEKLQKKNTKMDAQRAKRLEKIKTSSSKLSATTESSSSSSTTSASTTTTAGAPPSVHPDRAKFLK
ncbi:hypothetical protein TBLA_0B00780 [Henningerozyma blattae CBS 6284]|uniref:RRM domain-containing protein n=1 Tax=Henningerozyma blattae (strain ATCC 34711 / CBS 6284 / DSM 70876 / NBRC 10599 / NRRL Y-10934 / UCD 77-7) TaxID=1071380 RepID=I2GXR9_HENB6|nr:hypothetical protein TBLA_0B00780 [Tetrapisispora blattae CBS 6284]CCH58921.1 hypothetical protein TBLA_0B00780 [Tetrapisispora blattae CBS 6284]